MTPTRRSLVAALPFLLVACGSESDGGAGGGLADSEVITSDSGGDAVAVGLDDGDGGLGSVNLPRPAWLPADFPLPQDARIFITVEREQQDPPIYMIQARTRSDGQAVADAVVDWALARGLQAERLESPGPGHHIATLAKGNGLENANLQVFDKEGGIRQIVFAVSGRPLD